MKLTRQGFLKSIGSVMAASAVADQAQSAKMMAQDAKMLALTPPTWNQEIGGLAAQCPTIPHHFTWPSWRAKERVEEKKRFLRDADPARWRSGQFTSHEQKKQRWIMKREHRRFMAGPWRRPEDYMGTIQQWKANQTIGKTLEELRGQIGVQSNPTGRYFNT